MRSLLRTSGVLVGWFAGLLALHLPLLHLSYFWDEAGYYIPAALDFYRSGLLIPESTLPTGHTPLVMIYLGLLWRLLGFSPFVTRAAMILVAAAALCVLYSLARDVSGREPAAWSALLLALSPLFFAQSSLAHLDLVAALFTTMSILALLRRQVGLFALAASLAVLSKETAVILLPVAWVFAWRVRREFPKTAWVGLTAPLLPLIAWAVYYHHSTGYWTGNPEYLAYNLYATLDPVRVFWTLLRRLYALLIGGFNWVLLSAATLGISWGRKREPKCREGRPEEHPRLLRDFYFLAGGLSAAYCLALSLVGGAILPRYLLPIFPLFILATIIHVWRLPRGLARGVCLAAAGCYIGSWFTNPPYPFPFENNLAYADFVRLHQRAAHFLEGQPGELRILTAWPASDELAKPVLGYVGEPLRVVALRGFAEEDFRDASPESFDLLYLYSRKWEPSNNWVKRFPRLQRIQYRNFDYRPQIQEEILVTRFNLKVLAHFERRGQWVRIYSKEFSTAR